MNRKYTNRKYLDALEKKVLVFDGAMGTSLQVQNLTAEHFGGEQYNGCNDYLVISYPEAVEKVHRSFLEVGVDVLETDTFRSNRITMAEYGLQDRVIEINETAAKLARRLADEYSNAPSSPALLPKGEGSESPSPTGEGLGVRERFVAGSIGPSGKLPSANDPDLSNVTFDELVDVFREQAVGLIRGGVDVLLIETSQDILEVKAAIIGLHKAMDETQVYLPIQAQVTLDTTGRMLLGTDINASLAILEGMGIDVIGLNCSTGPEHMREPIRILGENSTLPVSCIPNAGLPLNVDGQAVYPLEPEPFANDLYEFVTKHNISIVGGCCGTTPAHLKLLVDKLNGTPPPPRPLHSTPQLASAMSALSMRQDPPPTLLGERCNAQGSRKFKRMLLEEDYDGILEIAREQVDGGAHALDISCAVTERPDEAELMRKVVKKLEMGVDVPLVIDSTELDVLEIALKTAPGRCLINSTHLEAGRTKADKVFALAKEHNAAVIVLTIDENGMAKTREKKLEVAKRIYDIAVNDHGLKPEDLVYDTLTFTLATGDQEFVESAIETIEGIRLIKQNLPGVMASLGVSNLSFGFAQHARPVLNSVMLYHCVQAGLDMAIVNPTHVTAYPDISQEEKDLAEDLIFNRRADALQRYIEHYENVTPTSESALADPTEGMTPEQRLHWKIVHRKKDGVEADIDEIINRTLIPNPSPEGGRELLPPLPKGEGWGEGKSPLPSGEGQGDGVFPSPLGRGEGEGKPHKHNPRLPDELKERIRELRKNATDAEQFLWRILRNRGFHDAKFRRQHPKAGFILDFYCHEAKLCVELDGSQHNEDDQIQYDEERTKILHEQHGIKVIRFWNSDILNKTDNALNELWLLLDERLPANTLTPNPSPVGEGDSDSLLPSGEGSGMRADSLSPRERDGVRARQHETAVHTLNNVLLPAMKEVGDKFGAGELILPFVLQSAEVMKKTVAHLENYLEKKEGVSKGKVVIATVYGDVHDIGKNLVKTILSNNGYDVIDLGKQVPAETIITKAVEANATAIGLSALLVSTSKQMPLIVNELHRRKHNIPVLIGGAAINRRFGRRILQTESGDFYDPGVFYCKDAFEGLETMDILINDEKHPALLAKTIQESEMELGRASAKPANVSTLQRSNVVPAPLTLPPSKFGMRVVKNMPLEIVFTHLNINELYRLSWGAKNTHGAEWDKLKVDFDARLDKMKREAMREKWLTPQAVYGLFPCQAEGDDLIIYNPDNLDETLTRMTFPRQPHTDHLCLADYYASVESGQMDVVAFQVVTVGQQASDRFEKMQSANDYTEAYFTHGLGVQTAEATADYLHEHIRREMGIAENQGKRYSWGYPAIPELEDHFKVFKLLPAAESELGLSLSVSGQLIPEQSTAAIIVHHANAKYYSVGESRVEQLMKQ
ncbi:MAG: Glutamate mutase sigma subunit [Anaerolineales bacterium]|nr:Glutamate mutase sigma subunit [Anaerolineales bacterium]